MQIARRRDCGQEGERQEKRRDDEPRCQWHESFLYVERLLRCQSDKPVLAVNGTLSNESSSLASSSSDSVASFRSASSLPRFRQVKCLLAAYEQFLSRSTLARRVFCFTCTRSSRLGWEYKRRRCCCGSRIVVYGAITISTTSSFLASSPFSHQLAQVASLFLVAAAVAFFSRTARLQAVIDLRTWPQGC